ncbi:MAG: DNA polymerase domain-containing protein [Thermoplasmatales archaeon]|nr:DNA polymerase domain-containing protein [Thermoplasmatales archaeon]
MDSYDVRLLTASYSRAKGMSCFGIGNSSHLLTSVRRIRGVAEGNSEVYTKEEDVVVELFGKTKNGKSITIRYYGFKPYFYVEGQSKEVIKALKENENVLRVEETELFVKGEMKSCAKVVIKYPWLVPDFRGKLGKEFPVLAADIPFSQRFIYDKNLGSCVRVFGAEESSEIKKNYTTDIVIRAEKFEECEPFKPELRILSFDVENSIKTGEIYTICCAVRENKEVRTEKIVGEESGIIKKFVETVNRYDPDIVTGYNIEGYDFPIITERAKHHNIENLIMGRDKSALMSTKGRYWRIHGRLSVDVWLAAKRELKPKRETLGHIAKIVLGEKKLDVDPSKIDEEWEKNPEKVIDYCLKDAELALRILEKIAVIEKAMDLATVSKLPFDDVLNGRTSTLIDSILIREADRNMIGVPCTRHAYEGERIVGGYVHSIQPGLYRWVVVMDFKSMYPSIIIANNICFTTLNPDGEIVSPTGVRFLSKEKRKGLLPCILEKLMNERDAVKKKMNETADPEKIHYYNGLQNAIKTLMNAFYGVFASSFYRFTNPKIGGSITAFARENIKNVINMLNEDNINVIYSDTDSIFFQSPYKSLRETVLFGEKISERFSKGGTILEFEKVLKAFFSHGKKKRYIGKVVWPKEDMLVRGYETRRTDAFDLQTEVLTNVFDLVLNDRAEEAIKFSRQVISDTQNGKIPVEKLTISRTVRDESDYKMPDTQAGVQASKKLMKMGYEFVPGMKVSWIVTNSRVTPQAVEPYIDEREFNHAPDWNYYAERIALSVSRVTEVFGVDEKTLLTGTAQKTLFGSFEPKQGKKKKKHGKKELKITDFM